MADTTQVLRFSTGAPSDAWPDRLIHRLHVLARYERRQWARRRLIRRILYELDDPRLLEDAGLACKAPRPRSVWSFPIAIALACLLH